jgi:hypothetical protein
MVKGSAPSVMGNGAADVRIETVAALETAAKSVV